MRKHAFTLIELIIVIIIVGILATLGFTSYTAIMEKARDVEAINALKVWMGNIQMYYLENNTLQSANFSNLMPEGVSDMCSSERYFKYNSLIRVISGGGSGHQVRLMAWRCLATDAPPGKPPPGTKARYVFMEWDTANNRTEIGSGSP